MTTVAQLIDQVSSHLHSFTGRIEASTWLIDDMLVSDTNMLVQHPSKIRQGFIEVDDELMFVGNVTDTSVEIAPFGRGYAGSTAATHALNAKVTNDPQFPRVRIFDAIKRGILAVQPELFAISTTNITSSPVVNTYELPADVDRILGVQYQVTGPTQEWRTVRNWEFDTKAATGTGKALVLRSLVDLNASVQVVYAKPYVTPTATTDDLEGTCLVPTSAHEALLWYACAQLVQFMEMPRLDLRGVEQQARAAGVQPGDPSKVAAQMFNLFERARLAERKRLIDKYPPAKHIVAR